MKFSETKLQGSYVVELEPVSDERGWFSRYYCKNEFKKIGHDREWVQMNHSYTSKAGSLRGLHFQVKPFREIKLVRCVEGKIFDVIVDLREGSSSFLQWTGIELSAENRKMLYIPEGFAHGFQCVTDNCSLLYHHSEFYQPGNEAGIRYDDPIINIPWPLPVTVISERDASHTLLTADFKGI